LERLTDVWFGTIGAGIKYLNKYPIAGIAALRFKQIRRYFLGIKSPHRDAVPAPKGR
jgi:hypothetical protein